MLKAAIQDWEKKSGEIHELRFFWFSGLFFLIAGVVSYRGGRVWLGLSLLFAAFSEMIYATSPSFFGSSTEFDRLLGNKLLFSALSLLLLLLTALLLKPVVDRLAPGRNSAAQPA
jgi:hypothetical protein